MMSDLCLNTLFIVTKSSPIFSVSNIVDKYSFTTISCAIFAHSLSCFGFIIQCANITWHISWQIINTFFVSLHFFQKFGFATILKLLLCISNSTLSASLSKTIGSNVCHIPSNNGLTRKSCIDNQPKSFLFNFFINKKRGAYAPLYFIGYGEPFSWASRSWWQHTSHRQTFCVLHLPTSCESCDWQTRMFYLLPADFLPLPRRLPAGFFALVQS